MRAGLANDNGSIVKGDARTCLAGDKHNVRAGLTGDKDGTHAGLATDNGNGWADLAVVKGDAHTGLTIVKGEARNEQGHPLCEACSVWDGCVASPPVTPVVDEIRTCRVTWARLCRNLLMPIHGRISGRVAACTNNT
ncbi:hypothetical protein GGX14DRAFT_408316 [Mycena pura]|uniref:Uncharacterized protein n=1 Tax=Mycena pura TaxID=153505 RepID=A0AAD6ULS7_9AGAR|nr:hypothetical protein GGX14DRAFT_408316 [Mycena pura]